MKKVLVIGALVIISFFLFYTNFVYNQGLSEEEGNTTEVSKKETSPNKEEKEDRAAPSDLSAPGEPVRLIFIHHSTGENWLSDDNGKLGIELKENNYFVSDTNYGWGPDSIGDNTDIGYWWNWFRGPNSEIYLKELYIESGQNSAYSRLKNEPSGENEIIMFKSCFPNSNLGGNASDEISSIENNSLKGESSDSENHTISNTKGIYIDLLEYFETKQDKLFIAITAPPLSEGNTDSSAAKNAREFNKWLAEEWLKDYSYKNVAVFDFYNTLTTNGGDSNTNDLGEDVGNHHRIKNGSVEYITDGDDDKNPNVLEYPSGDGDDHPSQAGNEKATKELVPFLNFVYQEWKE